MKLQGFKALRYELAICPILAPSMDRRREGKSETQTREIEKRMKQMLQGLIKASSSRGRDRPAED